MRNSKLKALIGAVNKEHGDRTISVAKMAVQDMLRISSGSLSMDRVLGGGWPVGRVSILRGSESSAKTATVYRTIGIAQHSCANCYRYIDEIDFVEEDGEKRAVGHCDCYNQGLIRTVQYPHESIPDYKNRLKRYEKNSFEELTGVLIDIERDFDVKWAEKLGVDADRLVYIQPDTMEQAIDIYDELLRTGEADLIVLDSIAAMAPSEEIEKSTEEWQQGLMARLMGKFNRKITAGATVVSKEFMRFPTQLWINQLREKIGAGAWSDNRVMPAGKSQLFSASVIMDMWPSKWEKESTDTDLKKDFQGEIATKVRINFKTLKNKTAPPLQKGSYDMTLSGDGVGQVDELKYFLAMSEKYGLFRVEGDGTNKTWLVGDESYKKKQDALDRIQEPKTHSIMRDILLKKMLGIQ